MTEEPPAQRVDGRTLRSRRTRQAIVDAVLALLHEGNPRATAPMIAERADVALRTLYQHFADLNTLNAAVAERELATVAELTEQVSPRLPLEERIEAFVRQRARFLEAITPLARASVLQEPFSPWAREEAQAVRRDGHRQIEFTFGPELQRRTGEDRQLLFVALASSATWRNWESLRTEFGLSPDQAQHALAYQLRGLLDI